MSSNTLNKTQALNKFKDLLQNPTKISKQDILDIVNCISVKDPEAAEDATTLLFAGHFTDQATGKV